jgi:hypothetical protein
MNPESASPAGMPQNKPVGVAVVAVALLVSCMMPYAPVVACKPRCPSSRQAPSRSIAAIAFKAPDPPINFLYNQSRIKSDSSWQKIIKSGRKPFEI